VNLSKQLIIGAAFLAALSTPAVAQYSGGPHGDWHKSHSEYGHRPPPPPRYDTSWKSLGSHWFRGRGERIVFRTGANGQGIDRLAIKPVDNNARCSRIRATFGNGQERTLDTDMALYRGQTYQLSIPGDVRSVRSLDMTCHSLNGRPVSLYVSARAVIPR